jgi:hypothetical protein
LNKFSGKGASTDLKFGKGTYFTDAIEKALNYCCSDEKIVFACKICMGKTFRPTCIENYNL